MSPEKLVYMANQIGKFFAHQGEAQAAASIADHLRKFWDPRMRSGLREILDNGGEGLEPMARAAAERLTQETAKAG